MKFSIFSNFFVINFHRLSHPDLTSLKTDILECKKEIRRVSSKLDISIMNQEKLCHFIIPGEKVIKRPSEMPPLPINTLEDLDRMEKFLANDCNLIDAVSTIYFQIILIYP